MIDSAWSEMGPAGVPGRDGINGRDGFDGKDGVDGFDGDSLNPMGVWNRSTTYKTLDVVTFKGSSYVAHETNKGKRPSTFKSLWQLVVAKAIRGERGATGPQGPRGRRAQTAIGDVKIGANYAKGLVLYIDPNGSPALAKADTQATAMAVVGLSTGASSYRTSGSLEKPGWGLTPGAIYYLSDVTAGDITTTPPTAQGSMIARVGIALSADVLNIEIAQTILL